MCTKLDEYLSVARDSNSPRLDNCNLRLELQNTILTEQKMKKVVHPNRAVSAFPRSLLYPSLNWKSRLEALGARVTYEEEQEEGPAEKVAMQELFGEVPDGRLALLDLSTFVEEDHKTRGEDEETLQMFGAMLPSSILLEHVDELILGPWKTEALATKLAETHPSLTVS